MILWTIIIVLSVILDQVSKLIVVNNMELYESVPLIEGFFSFSYIHNRGAAWGMLSDQRWVFIVVTAIALIVLPIILYRYRKLHVLFGTSLSLIIGGAFGNMIDRIFLGYVVDFLQFTFIDFPVFNIADVCIVVGTFMMAAYILFFDKTLFAEKNKFKAPEPAKEETTNDGTHNETV